MTRIAVKHDLISLPVVFKGERMNNHYFPQKHHLVSRSARDSWTSSRNGPLRYPTVNRPQQAYGHHGPGIDSTGTRQNIGSYF